MIALFPERGSRLAQDAQLMLRFCDGDDSAFEELCDRHYGWVRKFLASRISDDCDEDLTQEVFLRVFRARDRYQATAKFSTWLFVIASNVARNARRTAKRRHEVLLKAKENGGINEVIREAGGDLRLESPAQNAVRNEAIFIVRRAINSLAPRQAMALQMHMHSRLGYAEIATRMRTSPQAVKALVERARARLRKILSKSDAV